MMTKKHFRLFILLPFVFAYGCEKIDPSNNPEPISIIKPQPTAEDWRQAVNSITQKHPSSKKEELSDGVTAETFCTGPVNEKYCVDVELDTVEIIDDRFRKIAHYIPLAGLTTKAAAYSDTGILGTYIALKDNSNPLFFMFINYNSKDWIFINHVAIMADDEVIFERSFDLSEVDRDIESEKVNERIDFTLKNTELSQLSKIKNDSKISIRVTGEKGYIPLKKDTTNAFKVEFLNTQRTFHLLSSALTGKIPE